MKWPGKANIDLAPEGKNFELPPEGRYTVVLAGTKTRSVSSGAWLIFIEKIVGGDFAGRVVEEEFWIGEKMSYTYSRLGNICETAGWWPDLKEGEDIKPEAFALLWPTDTLRWTVDCVHKLQAIQWVDVDSYKDFNKTSIEETAECPYKKYIDVKPVQHAAWIKAGGRTWDSLVPASQVGFLNGVELQSVYGPADATMFKEAQAVEDMVADAQLPF